MLLDRARSVLTFEVSSQLTLCNCEPPVFFLQRQAPSNQPDEDMDHGEEFLEVKPFVSCRRLLPFTLFMSDDPLSLFLIFNPNCDSPFECLVPIRATKYN